MYREITSVSLWGAWALISVVVALAGPFGTFEHTFVWRLSYWGTLVGISIIISCFVRPFWRQVLKAHPLWQQDVAVATSLAVLFGPIIVWVNLCVTGPGANIMFGYGAAMGSVFLIHLGAIGMRRVLHSQPEQGQNIVSRDRLFNRITADPDARLSRISSDNHHIRIFTDDGAEHRILMRLRDAVLETDVEPGLFVHRSHWIARASVMGVKKEGPRDCVVLKDGSELPVGPKYRANLDFAENLSA